VANDGDVQSVDSLNWSVMSTYVYRFVGLETLPGRLADFDLQQFFQLGTGDVEAIRQRFRSDRRVAGALQLLFLRACGRPMDRSAVLPRNQLRYVAEVLQAPTLTIASLRSLYERRPTLYEHQQWARDYFGLRDLDPTAEMALVAMLGLPAAEAAHADELVTSACHWLYDPPHPDSRRTPCSGLGPRRVRRDRSQRQQGDHQRSLPFHDASLPRVCP